MNAINSFAKRSSKAISGDLSTLPGTKQDGIPTGPALEKHSLYDAMAPEDAAMSAVTMCLSVLIVSVNTVMIVVLARNEELHKVSNMYIASLAAADILVGLSLIPFALVHHDYFDHVALPERPHLCIFITGFPMNMIHLTAVHQMIISVDRCVFIKEPLLYFKHMDVFRTKVVIGVQWLMMTIYVSLPIVLAQPEPGKKQCSFTKFQPVLFLVYVNSAVYYACVVVTLVMYVIILNTASAQRKQISVQELYVTSSTTCHAVPSLDRTGVSAITEHSFDANASPDEKWPRVYDDGEVDDRRLIERLANIMNVDGPIGGKINFRDDPTLIANHANRSSLASGYVPRHSVQGSYPRHSSVVNFDGLSSIATTATRSRSSFLDIPRVDSWRHMRSPFKRHYRVSKKNVTFFAACFGVFFLTITPANIIMTLDVYQGVPDFAYYALTRLAFADGGANFFIFLYLNASFRGAVRKTFKLR